VKTKHMLSIEISTVSKARFLKLKKMKSFILNEPFLINVKLKNLSDNPFPGGQMKLAIKWPLAISYSVVLNYEIPPLKPNEKVSPLEPYEEIAAAEGIALIFCEDLKANDGQPIILCNKKGEKIDLNGAIHGFPVNTWEEKYTFFGLIVALITSAISLLINAFEKMGVILGSIINC